MNRIPCDAYTLRPRDLLSYVIGVGILDAEYVAWGVYLQTTNHPLVVLLISFFHKVKSGKKGGLITTQVPLSRNLRRHFPHNLCKVAFNF
jgi:hypothetical protein